MPPGASFMGTRETSHRPGLESWDQRRSDPGLKGLSIQLERPTSGIPSPAFPSGTRSGQDEVISSALSKCIVNRGQAGHGERRGVGAPCTPLAEAQSLPTALPLTEAPRGSLPQEQRLDCVPSAHADSSSDYHT